MNQVIHPAAPPATESELCSAPNVEGEDTAYSNTVILSSATKPRRAVVVDTQNVLGTAMQQGFGRVNYARILQVLTSNLPWIGVACVARPMSRKPLHRFVDVLAKLGFQVAIWESFSAGGWRKGDLDPLLIAEAAHLVYTEQLDELCLVAHDGDYRVLRKACAWRGVALTVVGLQGEISYRLKAEADRVVEFGHDCLDSPLWGQG
jgi:uncharacterized LabA/DUF88 family protein